MSLIIRPWAQSSDLLNVWKLFSSTGPNAYLDKRKACDIVQVWETRGNVPHHIISTAKLIDAQLLEALAIKTIKEPGDSSPISINSICSVHAVAILTFITGATDMEQTKKSKLSMFEVAKTIGLPAQLVEIRHVIVHEGLPSLSMLRQATKEALDWLSKEYWAHEVDRLMEKDQQ